MKQRVLLAVLTAMLICSCGTNATKSKISTEMALERDEEIIATTTHSQISYMTDAALGTPDEPTAIRFRSTDRMDSDGWYSISGIKLNKRPTHHGIYIHNNEKIVIK